MPRRCPLQGMREDGVYHRFEGAKPSFIDRTFYVCNGPAGGNTHTLNLMSAAYLHSGNGEIISAFASVYAGKDHSSTKKSSSSRFTSTVRAMRTPTPCSIIRSARRSPSMRTMRCGR